MAENILYQHKKFTSWSVNRLNEAMCDQWSSMNAVLVKNIMAYNKSTTIITLKGEVHVSLEFVKHPYQRENFIELSAQLSLSPSPFDLNTHVVNTFDFGDILRLSPEMHNKENLFSFKK